MGEPGIRPRVARRTLATGRHIVADTEQKISTEKARAGSSEHIVRYVLAISLALAVIAMFTMLVIW